MNGSGSGSDQSRSSISWAEAAAIWRVLVAAHLGALLLLWLLVPALEVNLERRGWALVVLPPFQAALALLGLVWTRRGQAFSRSGAGRLSAAWWIHLVAFVTGTMILDIFWFRSVNLKVFRLLELGVVPLIQALASARWMGALRGEHYRELLRRVASDVGLRRLWYAQLGGLLLFLLGRELAVHKMEGVRRLLGAMLGLELAVSAVSLVRIWRRCRSVSLGDYSSARAETRSRRAWEDLSALLAVGYWLLLAVVFGLWSAGSLWALVPGIARWPVLWKVGMWAGGVGLTLVGMVRMADRVRMADDGGREAGTSLELGVLLLLVSVVGLLPSLFFKPTGGAGWFDFELGLAYLAGAALCTGVWLQANGSVGRPSSDQFKNTS